MTKYGKRTAVQRALGLAVLFVLPLIVTSAADANTDEYYAPAASGQAINGGASCFYEDHGSERNTCSTAQYWNFPLLVDRTFAGETIISSIEVYGATSSNTVGCYGYSVEWGGAELYSVYQGSIMYPSTFGSVTHVNPGTFYNGNTVVQMVCVVNSGAYVNNITYVGTP